MEWRAFWRREASLTESLGMRSPAACSMATMSADAVSAAVPPGEAAPGDCRLTARHRPQHWEPSTAHPSRTIAYGGKRGAGRTGNLIFPELSSTTASVFPDRINK